MDDAPALREAWELRNAATATVVLTEQQVRRILQDAGPLEIIAILECFSPARSPGPDWTRSFEPLMERLWEWCSSEVLAAVEAEFRARGAAWTAIANSLASEHGEAIRARLQRRSAQSRLPAFTIE